MARIDNFSKQVEPASLTFSMFTREELLQLSVKKITTSLTFSEFGYPLPNSLYDPALGPLNEKSEPCSTCFKNVYSCPGHFGHIELPVLCINPLFYQKLEAIIKLSCMSCSMLQINSNIKQVFVLQMKLLEAGFIIEAQELGNFIGLLEEETEPTGKEKDEEDEEENPKKKLLDDGATKKLLRKYIKLAKSGSINCDPIKNIESIRNHFTIRFFKSNKCGKKCLFCKEPIYGISTKYRKFMVNEMKETETIQRMIMADELQKIFRNIWTVERDMIVSVIPVLENVKCEFPTDVMFMDIVPLLPVNCRPVNYVDNRMIEHSQTSLYRSIIDTSIVLRTIIKVLKDEMNQVDSKLAGHSMAVFNNMEGDTVLQKFHNCWQELQGHIDHIMNTDIPASQNVKGEGLKQIIEKKHGIIRHHMMGKRVNYAARSVITPDPNLNINEIGLPEAFAKHLTYPVLVTPWNVQELRKMILNGPNKYPGAVMVEHENGRMNLIPDNPTAQESIAKRLLVSDEKNTKAKTVHRHVLTGDMLLLNRQPTLHRPSIMAHSARILKGERTLRLHYANCKAYNADFDGDEMNAHYPQNELAKSEAYNIVNVCNQYLVPKDGTPLSGLIQDHMIAGVNLSIRGKFFVKEDYHQMVYTALAHKLGHLKFLPPAIQKPQYLWSGKQVLSTIIINCIPKNRPFINLTSTAKIGAKSWETDPPRPWKAGGSPFKNSNTMTEAEVIIKQGELLCGILDKTHYGSTPYGLVHCIYELYGGQYSNEVLSAFAKLFTAFLQREGFTLGVADILCFDNADKIRKKFVDQSRLIGRKAAAEAVGLDEFADPDEVKKKLEISYATNPKFRMIIDRQYKSALDSFTNNINKTCIPAGLITKFPYNNLQLMVMSGAKGSMVNCMQISSLLGQIELEGKRPPIMISGRTLPSFPPYETQPRAGGFIDGRFMTGIQPQEFFFHCMAGREGLIDTAVKTSRSGYLQRCLVKHLESLTVRYDLTVRDSDNSVIQFLYGEDGMDIGKVQFLNQKQLSFLDENKHIILDDQRRKALTAIEEADANIAKLRKKVKKWKDRHEDSNRFIRKSLKTSKKASHCPDPVVSKYQPDHYPGAINEYLDQIMEDYLSERKKGDDDDAFIDMLKVKAAESLVAPGEPVGMLAAQSIGEPSTQMTLNTFHFAGRGEMNVTLGIPRLREILMCAAKELKTPSMDIPFRPNISPEQSSKLCKKLTRVTVSNVLLKINVKSNFNIRERTQGYSLKFSFLPPKIYSSEYYVKPSTILKYMEKHFFKNMFNAFKNAANERVTILTTEDEKPVKEKKTTEDGGGQNKDDSDDDEDNMIEEESNFKRNRYEDEDSDADPDSEQEMIYEVEKHEEASARRSEVVKTLRYVEKYNYDTKSKLWCEIEFALPITFNNIDISAILKEVADKSIIWQTPHIRRAINYVDNKGELILRTDGINIVEMFKHIEILDLNKLYTNDIHAIANTYGIEAATTAIRKEIREVFKVYGITVDSRHLSLVADYMTYDGIYQALNRHAMADVASPLQQMSFESSLGFLRNAVTQGKRDMLRTPTSCLMVGYPFRGGTGSFGLVYPICKA